MHGYALLKFETSKGAEVEIGTKTGCVEYPVLCPVFFGMLLRPMEGLKYFRTHGGLKYPCIPWGGFVFDILCITSIAVATAMYVVIL